MIYTWKDFCIAVLPVQVKPLPSKPVVHVHMKLPSVSLQLALEPQGGTSSSHSLISASRTSQGRMDEICRCRCEPLVLTCTHDPISSVARVAGAGETSLCVSAVCILIAVVITILTLIDVCVESSTHIIHVT